MMYLIHNKISVLTHDFQTHHKVTLVKLNLVWDVLKIMLKNWHIIVMQIQYLTAVEKHLANNEKCCRNWKLVRKTLYSMYSWNNILLLIHTGFSEPISHVNNIFHCLPAVKCCICIINIFQFFRMIFNTSQAGLSLTVLYDVLKIMCNNWNFIVMQIYQVTAVEKQLANSE